MQSLTAEIVRAEAQRLARGGHLSEALTILEKLAEPREITTSLLLAKLYAQRGQFDLACRHFEEVLAAAPDNLEAARGLRIAGRLSKGPCRYLRLHFRPVVAALLVVGLAGILGWRYMTNPRITTQDLMQNMVTLENTMQRAGTTQQQGTTRIQEELGALKMSIHQQGEAQKKSQDELRRTLQQLQTQIGRISADAGSMAGQQEILESLQRIETRLK